MQSKLKAEDLRWQCEKNCFEPEISSDIRPIKSIIGQDRALRALETGLDIRAEGFNVYVAGESGTGRISAIDNYLTEFAAEIDTPDDWAYLHNFQDPYHPQILRLPPGMACELRDDMDRLVEEARSSLIKAFESDDFSNQREELVGDIQHKQKELLQNLNEEAKKRGFQIQRTATGVHAIPVDEEGEPISSEDFEALSPEKQEQIRSGQKEMNEIIKKTLRQMREVDKEIRDRMSDLKNKTAMHAIGILINEVKEKYEKLEIDTVIEHLEDVKEDILDNLEIFTQQEDQQDQGKLMMMAQRGQSPADLMRNYEVNVLVDNCELEQAPVVVEQNPTYNNLFGKIEKESQYGVLSTDFTLIREGSMHQANGGFLVIPVEELMRNPFAYESLKRSLKRKEVEIEEISERMGFISTKSLKPQPMPFDCKIVLVGNHRIFRLLYAMDKDFKELFKIKADFDSVMDRNQEHIEHYIGFISKLCEEEDLLPVHESGISELVEIGARLADDQQKLTSKFGKLADILREANYYCRRETNDTITKEHVVKAIEERHFRSNLVQDKIYEMIERGSLEIDISGTSVAQVNGLAVLDLGDITFGKPSRITVSTRLGTEGIIDIQREAEMGGSIHTKGVMILTGYLAETFGQEIPLSLSASIVFEQTYSEVQGDSASSTELYALMSSLAEAPVKQGIAVTGSVNQKGEVQSVGGINEKIEGYYDVCKTIGLNEEQGVIIPASNKKNLMLKNEVVEAVDEGNFHIWAIDHIDEGIEILTGIPAGSATEDGFEQNTIKARVAEKLESMANKMRAFQKSGSDQ